MNTPNKHWDRTDLDTSFLTLKRVYLMQPEIKVTRRVHLEIRFNLRSVLLDFQSFTEKPVFECAFAHPMLLFYHIWLKTVWIASPKEHENKRWET